MVTPTTGPFTRTQTVAGPETSTGFRPTWYYRSSTWYRQRKPYNLPLPYETRISEVKSWKTSFPASYVKADVASVLYAPNATWDGPVNKAYAKLKDDIGDASLWAVNLAEYRQTMNLVVKDGIVLWKFVRALNRFDFPQAARILGSVVPKGLKPTAKAFGNNFLKFHFGWEPLVKDIGAAVETLQSPVPSKRVVGKASTRSTGTAGDLHGAPIKWQFKNHCRQGCTVRVSNPNLYLASQLGFVNPAAIAWELVPFSFVVDWFVNVGEFLNNFTDLWGLTVTDPYTSILCTGVGQFSGLWNSDPGYSVTYTNVYCSRSTSLSGAALRVRPWKGVSPVRAATAISLLVQQLR